MKVFFLSISMYKLLDDHPHQLFGYNFEIYVIFIFPKERHNTLSYALHIVIP